MFLRRSIYILSLIGLAFGFLACSEQGTSTGDLVENSANSDTVAANSIPEKASTLNPLTLDQIPEDQKEDLLREVDTPQGKLYFVKVASINGIEENRKFRENMGFVKSELQKLIKLRETYENTIDPGTRDSQKAELEEAEERFNEFNQKLIDLYQLSATRNFLSVPEKAHLHVYASKEEIEQANNQANP